MIKSFRTEKRLSRELWSLLYDYLYGKYVFLENIDDYFQLRYFLQYNSGMVSACHFMDKHGSNTYRKARFKFGANHRWSREEKFTYTNKKETNYLTIQDLKILVEGHKNVYNYLKYE